MSTAHSNLIPLRLQVIGVFVATIGALATIAAAWLQFVPSRPELEASIVSVEEFTKKPSLSGLSAQFSYNGAELQRLVNIKVLIKNIGNKTIIGRGDKKDLIGETITVDFPDEFSVIDSRVISDDFNLKIRSLAKSIELEFSQWRANEIAYLSIFLEGLNEGAAPAILKKERDIVDGEFTVIDVSSISEATNPLYNYVDSRYVNALKVFGYFTLTFVLVLALLVGFDAIYARLKLQRWNRVTRDSFNEYVEQEFSFFNAAELEEIKNDPYHISRVIWKRFGGDEYPNLLADSWKDVVLFALFSLVLILGCLPLFVSIYFLY